MVVEEQAEPEQPRPPQAPVVRKKEAGGPEDVRRGPPKHLAFGKRLAHQTEGIALEITQPAMDQLGRRRGSRTGEIVLLAEENRQTTASGIASDAATVDTATDDGNV